MDFDFKPENYPTKHPAEDTLTIKLLFTAVVVLFAIIILILALYIYTRCCILRNRRRHLHNRRRQIVIYMDSNTPTTTSVRGLDSVVLNSLPVFEYSSETHHQMPECAVCLSEFEENDKGRLLPKCNHGFHIDCIDMWFHSHSTCPLCRSVVEPVLLDHVLVPVDVDDNLDVAEPGPSQRRKNLAVMVPPRTGLNLTEMGQNYSPAIQIQTQTQGFKSPLTTRFLSLTRNRRSNTTGTTPSGGVGSTSNEFVLDIDKGMDESTQCQSRVQTPR